jgi:hypothetical protein
MRNADCGLRNAEFGARSSECAGGGFRQLTPRVARIACFRGVESHALSLSGDPSAPLGIPGHRPTRVRRPRGHLRGTRRRAPSSHPREETPRLRSGTTVIAPLQSGDPSTALGDHSHRPTPVRRPLDCARGDMFRRRLRRFLHMSSRPSECERARGEIPGVVRTPWSLERTRRPYPSSPPCPRHSRPGSATRGIRTLQGMSRLHRPALRAGQFRST